MQTSTLELRPPTRFYDFTVCLALVSTSHFQLLLVAAVVAVEEYEEPLWSPHGPPTCCSSLVIFGHGKKLSVNA